MVPRINWNLVTTRILFVCKSQNSKLQKYPALPTAQVYKNFDARKGSHFSPKKIQPIWFSRDEQIYMSKKIFKFYKHCKFSFISLNFQSVDYFFISSKFLFFIKYCLDRVIKKEWDCKDKLKFKKYILFYQLIRLFSKEENKFTVVKGNHKL